MRIHKIHNQNKAINSKAKLKIKGKNMLTEDQLCVLRKQAEKIGNKNDLITFTLEKISKGESINLSEGIEYYYLFRRNLFASNNINGKQSRSINLMNHLSDIGKSREPKSDSELNNPFKYMTYYLKNLVK